MRSCIWLRVQCTFGSENVYSEKNNNRKEAPIDSWKYIPHEIHNTLRSKNAYAHELKIARVSGAISLHNSQPPLQALCYTMPLMYDLHSGILGHIFKPAEKILTHAVLAIYISFSLSWPPLPPLSSLHPPFSVHRYKVSPKLYTYAVQSKFPEQLAIFYIFLNELEHFIFQP